MTVTDQGVYEVVIFIFSFNEVYIKQIFEQLGDYPPVRIRFVLFEIPQSKPSSLKN